jgi:hypothetical protein
MLKLHTSLFIPKPSSALIWRKNANYRHMFETVHLERRCPPVLQFQACDARSAIVLHGTRSIKLNNLSNKLTHDIPFHRLTGQRFVLRLRFDWQVFDFVRNISDARDRVRMTRQTEGVRAPLKLSYGRNFIMQIFVKREMTVQHTLFGFLRFFLCFS